MSNDRDVLLLLRIYQDRVRPLLAEHNFPTLDSLDRSADLLQRALARRTRLNVGFVGESQVGKSTLINAMLERRALPSGGIGPLTAQATRVSYAAENALRVTYHGGVTWRIR